MSKEGENSFGISAVIFGILSILSAPGVFLLFFYGPIFGLIMGITALIFALKQKKISNNKWAKAGLILSIFGLILNVVVIIWLVSYIMQLLIKIKELQQSGALEQLSNAQNLQNLQNLQTP
jgi:hypothetical protein